MRAYKVIICGKVQGVGFRAAVRRHALKLGLQGYARNLPNGCVEVVVAAVSRDAVQSLINKLRELRTAEMKEVDVEEVDVENMPEGFEVY